MAHVWYLVLQRQYLCIPNIHHKYLLKVQVHGHQNANSERILLHSCKLSALHNVAKVFTKQGPGITGTFELNFTIYFRLFEIAVMPEGEKI